MRLDIREEQNDLTWYCKVFDRKTGKKIPLVVAVDDSTGQLIRYPTDGLENLNPLYWDGKLKLTSEIRNIEIVDMRL
jgi:hypothetical protein